MVKIISTTNGMNVKAATELWGQIAAGASYSFNKSHGVAYTVISYQAAYLKAHFPAEFYAAALTVEEDETKLKNLAADASNRGIILMPPDINFSSGRYETRKVGDVFCLYAPFDKIKGLSVNGVIAILEAKRKVGGKFESKSHFLANVEKRKVNSRVQAAMDDIGVFAEIDNQIPALHPDRLKRQMELLPGLIVSLVKSDRIVKREDFYPELNKVVRCIKKDLACDDCTLFDATHSLPTCGDEIKFMVVFDCASKMETKGGRFMAKGSQEVMRASMHEADIEVRDGYYTGLVKTEKSGKLTTAQISACSHFLTKEVDLIKPPIIICMGSAAIRHFLPDIKGNSEELCGQVFYSKEMDASIVCGINPAMVFFRPEVREKIDDVFAKVKSMIS